MDSVLDLDLMHLKPGFDDPVHDAQRCFRSLLDAFAHPGRVSSLPVQVDSPHGLSVAQTAALLTLCDYDTALWLPEELREGEAGRYLRFHSGCRIEAQMCEAQFVVLRELAALPAPDQLRLGEPSYPDRSATLLVEVGELAGEGPIRLHGPGIAGSRSIAVAGWSEHTRSFMRDNHAGFPLGVDVLLCCGAQVCALPRSCRVEC